MSTDGSEPFKSHHFGGLRSAFRHAFRRAFAFFSALRKTRNDGDDRRAPETVTDFTKGFAKGSNASSAQYFTM